MDKNYREGKTGIKELPLGITGGEDAELALRGVFFYRQLIADLRVGVIVYDSEFRYREWNKFMEEFTGLSREEVLGKRAFDLFPHMREQGIDKLLLRALEGETLNSPDTLFRIPVNGKSGWVVGSYAPQKEKNGKIVGVTGIIYDITDRKLAETTLRENEERLRLAITATGFGTYTYDFPSEEHCWSPELLKFYGLGPDDPLPLDADKIPEALHPHDRHAFLAVMTAAVDPRGNGLMQLEFRILRPDRSVRWLQVHGHTIFDGEAGKLRPLRATGIVIDITELKQAEELLVSHRTALEQKNAALREMVEQIAIEKNKIKEQVVANVNELLLPLLRKIKLKNDPGKYIKLLERNLREITSSFGLKISRNNSRLTPKEVEICNFIKSGFSSKDIAAQLNCSVLTVSKHRRNIRKKLGLSGKKDNLISFLQAA